jgi:hypothetical protein
MNKVSKRATQNYATASNTSRTHRLVFQALAVMQIRSTSFNTHSSLQRRTQLFFAYTRTHTHLHTCKKHVPDMASRGARLFPRDGLGNGHVGRQIDPILLSIRHFHDLYGD